MTDDDRCRLGSLVQEVLQRAAVSKDVTVRLSEEGWANMRSGRNVTSFTITESRYEFQWLGTGGGQQRFATSDQEAAVEHAVRMLDGRLR